MATGICTYVLLIVAGLLPVGLASIKTANQQVTQTEIFNQIWSEVNTTPYSSLSSYPRLGGLSYFDGNGEETNSTAAVFWVQCTQPTVTLATTSSGTFDANELNSVQVKIGYHVNPGTVTSSQDPRVTTRTFVVTRRDGSTSQFSNGW